MPRVTPAILPAENIQQPLLWVDCEFTGLDLEAGHKIIEIGALVTDLALNELDTYQSFVDYEWDYVKSHMDINPWWTGRNEDKARMKEGMKEGRKPATIDHDLTDLVVAHFGSERPPLCGNSIGNDKRHIEAQFPDFADHLHYRVIDVSSLRLLAQKYSSVQYDGKAHKHYALDDIRESVDELRFLLTRLGIVDLSRLAITHAASMPEAGIA